MATVVLATGEFLELAQESARNEGIADARIVSVTHPIGGEPHAALAEKADTALESVLALDDSSD